MKPIRISWTNHRDSPEALRHYYHIRVEIMRRIICCGTLLAALAAPGWSQIPAALESVDQAVEDLDLMATSMRRVPRGLRVEGEHTSLFKLNPGPSGSAVYYRLGQGFIARFERMDYAVFRGKDLHLNISPEHDREFIELVPPNMVFDLRPLKEVVAENLRLARQDRAAKLVQIEPWSTPLYQPGLSQIPSNGKTLGHWGQLPPSADFARFDPRIGLVPINAQIDARVNIQINPWISPSDSQISSHALGVYTDPWVNPNIAPPLSTHFGPSPTQRLFR